MTTMSTPRGLATLRNAFGRQKREALFITKKDKFIRNGDFTVILAPEFYWVKKVKLPVKSLAKARNLAPSVFEGNLPEGRYSYEIRRAGDGEFIVMAYNKEQIQKELEKIFPAKSKIKEIYFAQDALGGIKECTTINEKAALMNIDDIIIQVPRSCVNSDTKIAEHLKDAVLGRHKIRLSAGGDEILPKRDIILASVLVALLLVAFLGEYFIYKKAQNDLDQKRSEIIKENKLPPTMIQIRSIQKSLGKKFAKQKKLREALYALSKINLREGDYFESIELGEKEMAVKLHLADPTRQNSMTQALKRIGKVLSTQMQENILSARIAL